MTHPFKNLKFTGTLRIEQEKRCRSHFAAGGFRPEGGLCNTDMGRKILIKYLHNILQIFFIFSAVDWNTDEDEIRLVRIKSLISS